MFVCFQALEEARAELEKTHNLEEFKAKALQTHKQAQEEMEAEVLILYMKPKYLQIITELNLCSLHWSLKIRRQL